MQELKEKFEAEIMDLASNAIRCGKKNKLEMYSDLGLLSIFNVTFPTITSVYADVRGISKYIYKHDSKEYAEMNSIMRDLKDKLQSYVTNILFKESK